MLPCLLVYTQREAGALASHPSDTCKSSLSQLPACLQQLVCMLLKITLKLLLGASSFMDELLTESVNG